jgi:hypothetical protein
LCFPAGTPIAQFDIFQSQKGVLEGRSHACSRSDIEPAVVGHAGAKAKGHQHVERSTYLNIVELDGCDTGKIQGWVAFKKGFDPQADDDTREYSRKEYER